jgi:hypothetical protein
MVVATKTLSAYQIVFNRLVRLKYISILLDSFFLKELFSRESLASRSLRSTETLQLGIQFKLEAQTFIRENLSFIFNFGIRGPWEEFLKALEAAMTRESQPDAISAPSSTAKWTEICDLETFSKAHDFVLERILRRLFLQKKQQAMLSIIEDIEHLMLQFVVNYTKNGNDHDQLASIFYNLKSRTALLRKVIEKIERHVAEDETSWYQDKESMDDLMSYSFLLQSICK